MKLSRLKRNYLSSTETISFKTKLSQFNRNLRLEKPSFPSSSYESSSYEAGKIRVEEPELQKPELQQM